MRRARRHLFLSPHPDDIAFSAFASLVRVPPGETRTLVTVFSRSCYTYAAPGVREEALTISSRRMEEDSRFARAHGAEWVPLGFADSSLRPLRAGEEYRRASGEEPLYPSVLAKLRGLLEAAGPEAVCHVPLGISQHVDHLMVRDAVLALRGGPQGLVFHEDLPYAERHTEEQVRDFVHALGVEPPLESERVELTRSWDAKRRAVRMYESQLEPDTLERLERHARRVASGGGLAERVWKAGRP